MNDEIATMIRSLFSLQADSGAFAAIVHNCGASIPDYNGLVTALVLREMEEFARSEHAEPLNRALDFLEDCTSSSGSGMFSLWPPNRTPSWALYNPDDCDTTAVIAAELFHFNRITPETARFIALDLMPEFQTSTGEFLAWRTRGVLPNPADIVLNVNVVAFLAQTGCHDSAAYRNACRAICDAVSSCEASLGQLDRLMPFYPETAEISVALRSALRRGAHELLPTAALLETFSIPAESDGGKTLFANVGRHTFWSSEAVDMARRVRSAMTRAKKTVSSCD
jgi:hypothetical protein